MSALPKPIARTLEPKFLTNRKGEKTGVALTLDEFEQVQKVLATYRRLHKDVPQLEALLRFQRGIKSAFKELKEVRAGKKKAKPLSQLIEELGASSNS
jgi:hypothetical protein